MQRWIIPPPQPCPSGSCRPPPSRPVALCSWRLDDHHPLPYPHEQHPAGVLQMLPPFGLLHLGPLRAPKTWKAAVRAHPVYVWRRPARPKKVAKGIGERSRSLWPPRPSATRLLPPPSGAIQQRRIRFKLRPAEVDVPRYPRASLQPWPMHRNMTGFDRAASPLDSCEVPQSDRG